MSSISFDEAQRLASRLRAELGRAIVGQDAVVQEILTAFFAGGHCLLRGVPGLAKTLLIKTLAQAVHLKFNRIQFTPDLMPSDIIGTEVIEEDRATGRREIRFIPRSGVRQRDPRRRDQPHAAEDAGRAARGDAGIPGHGQRRALRARAAALRAGDAEPDRAGRHVSAAGGAARSLHVQRRHRLPDRGRRAPHPGGDDRRGRAGDHAGGDRRTISRRCGTWCATSRRRPTSSTTRCGSCARAGRPGRRGRRAAAGAAVGEMGRRPARGPGAGPRREGARAARRPQRRRAGGRPRGGAAGAAPPDPAELPGRSRRRRRRTRSWPTCSTRSPP